MPPGDLTVARDGSIYVLGSTRSTDFPTTPDAVQRRFGGADRDVFLVWPSPDDGAVFIGGLTWSPDFPGARTARFGPSGEQ